MNNESDKYVIFSTICGILLTISEMLPYIKSIKSNGIMEFIIESCILLLKKCKSHDNQNNDENERLLENFLNERFYGNGEEEIIRSNNIDIQQGTFINDVDKQQYKNKCIKITSDNIVITFNSPKEIKIT